MNIPRCNRPMKKEEEVNLKTLPLTKLVPLIEQEMIGYYLEKVSSYLKSDKKDLWFPNITPNIEAFLVRMIHDIKNLKSILHLLDEKNRELAVDVIDTIEVNRPKYTVMHVYVITNLLIYRKAYLMAHNEPSEENQSEQAW